jgi:hypothetical protein
LDEKAAMVGAIRRPLGLGIGAVHGEAVLADVAEDGATVMGLQIE